MKRFFMYRAWFPIIMAVMFLVGAVGGCRPGKEKGQLNEADTFKSARIAMVARQIEGRGVGDSRVLAAMRKVPRHRFVPENLANQAYDDNPLSIGWNQTISQPYIVGLMTELLDLQQGEKVLEIGTGSGYQAAVLAELTDSVFSIEIVPELAERAEKTLAAEGCAGVRVLCGDGYRGWPDEAPFQGIIVTAAPEKVPQPLIDQLAEGGRLVIPVGDLYQELILLRKENGKIIVKSVIPVRFVPMTGEAERDE